MTSDDNPVYVDVNSDGEESIVFHPSKMEEGKLYPFIYKKEQWALQKTGKGVDFMKFYPDRKSQLKDIIKSIIR